MASDYAFAVPPGHVDAGIVQFFQNFYRISDMADAHDVYVDQFTPDATVTVGSRSCRGKNELRPFREQMWADVLSRKHTVYRMFVSEPGSAEVMLYGSVAHEPKHGAKSHFDWAARAVLTKGQGRGAGDDVWRLGFYQVYIDTAGTTKH